MEEAEGGCIHLARPADPPEPAPSLVDLLQATATERRATAPDLTSEAASSYLDHLLSLPLKTLLAEASVISNEAGSVESELTNLCYREYPTFISVHNCSSAVTSAFDDFSSSLGRLLDAVPALEEECRTFVRSTSGVQNARAKAALVQEHQDKLFDLLEIPQLMDTCVRNGYYQEALELSAHTQSLVKRYPSVELVHDVAKEVDGVLQLMLAQLLALLREPIKLPALVKTVGYLRRLGTIEESELSLVFLISRLSNFKAHLVALERDRTDAVRYVRKYVDLFREHVFDIVSQFSAIFLEGNPSPSAASQLSSFVGQCVNELVALVSSYVPKMTNDAASLSSILVQLGYCSLAFARVGLDFSSLIAEPFSDAVLLAFSQSLGAASTSLSNTLAHAVKSAGSPAQVLMAQEYIAPLLAADSPLDFIKWEGTFENLPTDLARFPPLAILVNAHLSALNSLRLLAPLHLHPQLSAAQASALVASTHSVAQYVRQTVALSDPLVGSPIDGGRMHKRQNSSSKAALIRRNSEGQLTPEARTAKRRETQWVCVAFADTWVKVVSPLLIDALDNGVYEGALPSNQDAELREALHAISSWVEDQLEDKQPSPVPILKAATRQNGGLGLNAKSTPNGSGAATPHAVPEEDEAAEAVFVPDSPVKGLQKQVTEEPEEMAAAPVDEQVANGIVDESRDDVEAIDVVATEPVVSAPEATVEEPAEDAPREILTLPEPEPVVETPEVDSVVAADEPPAASDLPVQPPQAALDADPVEPTPTHEAVTETLETQTVPDVVEDHAGVEAGPADVGIVPTGTSEEPESPGTGSVPPSVEREEQVEAPAPTSTEAEEPIPQEPIPQEPLAPAPVEEVAEPVSEPPAAIEAATPSSDEVVVPKNEPEETNDDEPAVVEPPSPTSDAQPEALALEPEAKEPEPQPAELTTPVNIDDNSQQQVERDATAAAPVAPTSDNNAETAGPADADETEEHEAIVQLSSQPETGPAEGAVRDTPPSLVPDDATATPSDDTGFIVPDVPVPGVDAAVASSIVPAALDTLPSDVPGEDTTPEASQDKDQEEPADTSKNKVGGDASDVDDRVVRVPAAVADASSVPVDVDVDVGGADEDTPTDIETPTPADSAANSRAPSPTPAPGSAVPSTSGGGGGAKKKKKNKKGKKK
ncbi:uncharacterized protein EHS24_006012 [Apiotrichum porosum]|uniref:Conserved oligomeric Golgi complex subunit 8 n=1 Tax=Apiotrichum porosum TaxID=105984 RepID=A0A427Y067_9TREE|nr:uncharacterized protein EHS24_006012 [Apiotrichum porosum]RSH84491.1 hypothetical protein EHS24_006012 [Apiotrichum porosum]